MTAREKEWNVTDLVLKSPEAIGRKNFSRNNTGKRKASDLYETPHSMTRQLLDVEPFSEWILEPAAGHGAISSVLRARGWEVVEDDINEGPGGDFLVRIGHAPCIITNPPYTLALQFILKARQVATWKFAFLLPIDYLHGNERYRRVFQDTEFPLARVWVFTRRPMLGEPLRDDGKYHTGMQTYAWFVWDRYHRGPATIGWIDNQEFVLKAGEQ